MAREKICREHSHIGIRVPFHASKHPALELRARNLDVADGRDRV
jgi:hypothetical protein